ncbi:MAG TPA: glycosyltransferase [Gaiellaceae bacterium]|nr:glycosyltransferase [Gaiellaceae bacterium]
MNRRRNGAPGRRPRVAIVVNADGLQVRRAEAFRCHLEPEFAIDVVVAPGTRALRRVGGGDAVYVIDPGRRGFPAAIAAWLARSAVVVEVGDPQGALYRVLGRGTGAVAAGAAIDRLVARHADALVVRGRGLADVLRPRVPWAEIPDGVDVDLFRPGVDGDVRSKLGIPANAFVVGLAGSLAWAPGAGIGYGWDVVECLAQVRDETVWGLVVGDGEGRSRLRERADELGVGRRLVLPGHVPHEDVPRYLCAMDVCVSTQTNDPVGHGRTTAKLPEYLACDRFVLATRVGAAAEVLPPGMLLPYEGQADRNHPARLARRVAELLPRRAELRRGAGTRAIAVERYAYPLLALRLAALVRRVLSGRGRRDG